MINIKVIKSDRKTVGIQINPDLSVTVRAPRRATKKDIERIIKEKEPWILKHIEIVKNKRDKLEEIGQDPLSYAEIKELADKAMSVIPERTEYYSKLVGVNYGRITIRNQKTLWGSCSNKGNLNFNCLLMLAPPDVIDYVVVHELCHIKEMNHSKAFWNEVEKVLPDYKTQIKWLKNQGSMIMQRQKQLEMK